MKRNWKKSFGRLVLSLIFFLILLFLIFVYPPSNFLLPTFFLLLFLAIYFLLSALLPLASPITIGIVGYLALRYFHMDNSLNLILLTALVVSLGLYQSRS